MSISFTITTVKAIKNLQEHHYEKKKKQKTKNKKTGVSVVRSEFPRNQWSVIYHVSLHELYPPNRSPCILVKNTINRLKGILQYNPNQGYHCYISVQGKKSRINVLTKRSRHFGETVCQHLDQDSRGVNKTSGREQTPWTAVRTGIFQNARYSLICNYRLAASLHCRNETNPNDAIRSRENW